MSLGKIKTKILLESPDPIVTSLYRDLNKERSKIKRMRFELKELYDLAVHLNILSHGHQRRLESILSEDNAG